MKPVICVVCFFIFYCLSACSKGGSTNTPVTPTPPADTTPTVAAKTFYQWNKFSMGADLSYVNEIEDFGGTYKDSGVTKDPFLIFKTEAATPCG